MGLTKSLRSLTDNTAYETIYMTKAFEYTSNILPGNLFQLLQDQTLTSLEPLVKRVATRNAIDMKPFFTVNQSVFIGVRRASDHISG